MERHDLTASEPREHVEELSLDQAATLLLEECRMVLPGIQALFGFQFVAVFNSAFGEKLSPSEQLMHLAALLLVLVAAALVLAPAAIHRLRQPRAVSLRFVLTSTRLLAWSMAPLALGTTIDVYLVAHVITRQYALSIAAGALAVAAFVIFWAVLPRQLPRVGPGHEHQ